jgi:hypothetical protein
VPTCAEYALITNPDQTTRSAVIDNNGRMTRQLTTDGVTLGQIAYLSGNRMQATDADGRITTTSFQAFGSPAYDNALVISAPEGQTTTMARDVFGMIQSVNQSGGGASLTRSTSYDAYYRPCKTLDPEGGATLNGYNAASQMIRRNRGQTLRFPLIFSSTGMLVGHSIVAVALTAIAGLR